MRRGTRCILGMTAASAMVLAGCSNDPEPAEEVTTTASVTEPAPPPSGLNGTGTNEDTGELVTTSPVPEWDQASRDSALRAANEVMTAFARPDLSFEQWWAALQPMLDQQASRDYSYMEPSVIPVTTVTGEGALLDVDSAYIARVAVPTDAGEYTVLLSRVDADAPWLASRMTPPEETS